ncbi:DegT/DnrJ/EryC1/StrS family aminotransferase [Streptoalloteichus hindustanus]|uniref:Perosamine synthetase n=1 Tax=Streptoalloteichus hindustanus TaxID=2017 RepID=A0A1M5CVE6_STRHI|nr:DegT/DnrJ/EryC1/StrS family aminotransferase [Streptoalloteichus hindustanus]SHF58659.1 perosamine synthetase [Streptoalloteichus hindustanus]
MDTLAILGGEPVRERKIVPRFVPTEDTRRRIDELLASGALSDFYGGPWCAEFERRFAEYHGVRNAVAVSSGTCALHTAVTACGIGPGDEVLIPTSCFFTAATVVLQQNGVPVLVDCLPESFEIDLDAAESLVTPRTKAILPVHMYGYPSDIDRLTEFADRHGLLVIEDACQSHGARFRDRPMGTNGTVGCFSFGAPRKHINCGEGGMLITDDDELARQIRRVANKGKDNGWFTHRVMGFSYVMPELNAIIGIQGVEELDELVVVRRAVSDSYDAVLRGTELEPAPVPDTLYHSYFRKVVLLPERFAPIRDWVVRAIEWENVSAKPPHAALHTIAWLRERLGPSLPASFPVADRELARVVDLEVGPSMTAEDGVVSGQAVLKVWRWVREHEQEAFALAEQSGRYTDKGPLLTVSAAR